MGCGAEGAGNSQAKGPGSDEPLERCFDTTDEAASF